MLRVNQLAGFGVPARDARAMSHITSASVSNTAASQTISGVALGEPDPSRLVVVAISVGDSNDRSLSSASIGGVSATIVASAVSTGNRTAFIIAAVVPNGTTGDLSVTFSGTITLGWSYGIWRLVNLTSNTAHDFASSASASDISRTVNLDIPASGFAIAAASAANSTNTWTNATSRYTYTITAFLRGADTTVVAEQLNYGITNANCRALAAASWA